MSEVIKRAQSVLQLEADSVLNLISRIDQNFENAVNLIFNCQGKVIVTGIGKSGQIARKMSSTLSSTGTPSLFLHPAESSHGDLGVITNQDLVIALSYGGETFELSAVLKFVNRNNIPLIALTGKPESTLAKSAAVHLNVSVQKEACPLNLAPTSSSTAMLAMCDALAMCVLDLKNFNAENFAEFHPSGSLGAKLLKVKDIMKTGEALPFVLPSTSMKDVLTKMTHQSVRGTAGVINDERELVGVITDGDVRRFLEKSLNPLNSLASDVMSKNPKTIDAHELSEKAMFLMEQFHIQVLIVTDKESANPKQPVGMILYQDLLSHQKIKNM